MNEFIEKLIGRLEEYLQSEKKFKEIVDTGEEIKNPVVSRTIGRIEAYESAIEIVNQLAEEYKLLEKVEQLDNGWIPCSEMLPKTEGNYCVTRKSGKVGVGTFLIWRNGGFFNSYDNLGKFPDKEVIAWQQLPEPYQPKGE